jgi:ferrous iron transport protein B
MKTLALVGNPNSGKTTFFNDITGSYEYVGNWPGVTVEKKEGKIKGAMEDIKLVDLPGIYSLSPYTAEEVISREFIMNEKPEVVINILDASNLERNLYLTIQLREMNVPMVVLLNMMDIVEKRGTSIDVKVLEKELGVKIFPIIANKGDGKSEVIAGTERMISKKISTSKTITYSQKLENGIKAIGELLMESVSFINSENVRWHAIKVLEKDEKIINEMNLLGSVKSAISKISGDIELEFDDDAEGVLVNERYRFIENIMDSAVKKGAYEDKISNKIDSVLTNRILAIPIFLSIMWFIYHVSITSLGTYFIDLIDGFFSETVSTAVSTFLIGIGTSDTLISLVVDGMIGGVGAVLTFVPQIMILYFFIALLEDSGYMARVAFVMDKLFRRFGLSGKSFIPMLIGSGCSIPGIIATRTLRSERDRKLTILLTPFISCGAKMPIYVLFASAFFPLAAGKVVFGLYIFGIVVAIVSGIILKNTVFKGEAEPFVMELPEYRIPTLKSLTIHMWDRGKGFIKKAGSVILLASVFIWGAQYFTSSFGVAESMDESLLATLGGLIAPIFKPMGLGDWISSAAIVTGLGAKEAVVSTFGVIYGLGEVAEDNVSLVDSIRVSFTPVKALAFMTFNLLAAPCAAAIGAMKQELGSVKGALYAASYQTLVAWVMATLVYQIGSLLF